MPLNADNIIQSNSGGFEATSGSATLGVGSTAGSLLIICAAIQGDAPPSHSTDYTIDDPSGFEKISAMQFGNQSIRVYIWARRNSPGSESSWSLVVKRDGVSASQQVLWTVLEITGAGLDPTIAWNAPTDLIVGDNSTKTSQSTANSLPTSCPEGLSIAIHAALGTTTGIPAISAHTNNFQEVVTASRASATNGFATSVSVAPTYDAGQYEATVSISPTAYAYATLVVVYADGAHHMPELEAIFGAEMGTALGIATGSAVELNTAPWDAVTGSPAVTTSTPRTGAYCLELSSSAAAEALTWTTAKTLGYSYPISGFPVVARVHVRFPTSLPAADVELFSIEAGSLANGLTCWFRNSSSKIAMKSGTGTEIASDATVAADTWIGIDVRYDARNATHVCDWQVDYDSTDATAPVAQTQATGGGTSAAEITTFRVGWSTAKTATVRYDDIGVCKEWGAYPIGDLRVRLLKVDPAGTPTVSGSSTNFRTYSNNGTLATWSAADTRTRLSDVPPTIGASSDGLTQITTAINDYVEIPMETFVAAPDHVFRGARWYFCGWAASTTAATFGLEVRDSVGEGGTGWVTGVATGDHGFDNALAVWICRMHKIRSFDRCYFYPLTQAKVDSLACRVGYSGDAAPDVGIHSVFIELATAPAEVVGVYEAEGGAFSVYAKMDPISHAIASLLATTPVGTRGGTLTWTVGGTPDSQYVGPNTVHEESLGASTVAAVTSYGFDPDPG